MNFHCSTTRSHWDVAVVGSGIGGLTAAALLARDGARVVVCEQHARPGGFCHGWGRGVRLGGERAVFTFDSAVHDISGAFPGGSVRTILGRLGPDERLHWRRVSHEYCFPFGTFPVDEDDAAYLERLKGRFPAEAAGLGRYFKLMRDSYEELSRYAGSIGGLPWQPRDAREMGVFRKHCPTLMRYVGTPFVEVRDALIKDPALAQVLSVLSAYVTDDVRRLTFPNMLPLFGYYCRGGYYPRGGSQALADALAASVVENGGRVRFRAPVERILVDSGRARGLRLRDGSELLAGAVISNADLIQTLNGLLRASDLPDRLSDVAATARPSNSAFMVYLALDYDPAIASSTLVMRGRDGVILSCPPFPEGRAPAGYTTMTLTGLIPADEAAEWDRHGPDYRARKRAEGDRLIALASSRLPDLADHIVYREDGSPATVRRFCWTSGGAAYGVTPATRWPTHGTPIRGLYVVGASTGLGPGIEAVMVGAASLADQLRSGISSGLRTVQQTSEVADG